MKIYIYSYHRKLSLKAGDERTFFEFVYSLDKYLKLYQKNQKEYRFNSFAPVRENNHVEFFVDGAEYFREVALAI
jgi:phosphatidylserine/phosphatidylglycerophosphate/cardiolipin synthase-like enzyme